MSLFSEHAVLTDEQVLDLAKEITERVRLLKLAIGLGMPYDVTMVEELGVSKEAYRMLRSWLKLQPDRNTAHRNLVLALANADMLETIHVILPTKPEFSGLRRTMSVRLITSKPTLILPLSK